MGRDELTDYIKSYLSQLMEIPAHDIDVDSPLERYGLDSIGAAGLSGHLSEALKIELSPDMAYDYPTIGAITGYLVSVLPASAAVPANA
jgi:acyl carrier protein